LKSLKGHLLIAVPELGDVNFFRSVVLMVQHTDQGAMGLVLNRPTSVTVRDVWKEVFDLDCNCRDLIHIGGPVEGPLILIHSQLARADMDVLPGLFVSTAKEHLQNIIEAGLPPFRLFSGYAGWGAGQLEQEIDAGGWLTMPAEGDQVFASPDDLWKRVCESFGTQIMQGQMGTVKHFPTDPSLN
jgi:putative transcriptional regulator